MPRIQLAVPTLTSGEAARQVSSVARDVPGVVTVAVDVRCGRLVVDGDVTEAAMREALRRGGHPAR
jgi:hypothetical protein